MASQLSLRVQRISIFYQTSETDVSMQQFCSQRINQFFFSNKINPFLILPQKAQSVILQLHSRVQFNKLSNPHQYQPKSSLQSAKIMRSLLCPRLCIQRYGINFCLLQSCQAIPIYCNNCEKNPETASHKHQKKYTIQSNVFLDIFDTGIKNIQQIKEKQLKQNNKFFDSAIGQLERIRSLQAKLIESQNQKLLVNCEQILKKIHFQSWQKLMPKEMLKVYDFFDVEIAKKEKEMCDFFKRTISGIQKLLNTMRIGFNDEIPRLETISKLCQEEARILPQVPAKYRSDIQKLSKYILRTPDAPEGYFKRGHELKKYKLYRLAEMDMKHALQKNSMYLQASLELGRIYSHCKESKQKVLLYYQDLEAKHKNDIRVLNEIGSLYQQLGESQKSQQYYKKSINLKDNYEAHHSLGVLHLWQGRLNHAKKSFDRALQIKPESVQSLELRSQTYAQLGISAEAQKDKKKRKEIIDRQHSTRRLPTG